MAFSWIEKFDAFFFDFDGLLVDSESLHFKAYQQLLAEEGLPLPWNLSQYCKIAYSGSTAIREAIYRLYPSFEKEGPPWEGLYERKKVIYNDLLTNGSLELLPGVVEFLERLQSAKKKRAVATNSTLVSILQIKKQLPALEMIPIWITREDYQEPKPAPDAYLKAIDVLSAQAERKIGFEDSLRGYIALKRANIFPVLIAPFELTDFDHEELKGVCHFESMRVMDSLQK